MWQLCATCTATLFKFSNKDYGMKSVAGNATVETLTESLRIKLFRRNGRGFLNAISKGFEPLTNYIQRRQCTWIIDSDNLPSRTFLGNFFVLLRARTCNHLWSPGIDSEETIPPAHVAWQAGTTNRVVVPARQAGNRFLWSLKTGSGLAPPPHAPLCLQMKWLHFCLLGWHCKWNGLKSSWTIVI
jgi:hypothetical protein